MTAAEDLHAALWALLDAIPNIAAYDGEFPDAPPADADGRAAPYAVLWPSPGGPLPDIPLGVPAPGGLDWVAQVTIAAGSPAWVLPALTAVRRAVLGRVLVTGASPLADETPRGLPVQRDPDTPSRWFAPLLVACGAP